jgi:hypothetical protein
MVHVFWREPRFGKKHACPIVLDDQPALHRIIGGGYEKTLNLL